MGLHEVKMTPEEVDAYIASRITDLADSIINIKSPRCNNNLKSWKLEMKGCMATQ